jgi:CheY-like chemotaxis protein/signal transduction histidine kinase
MQLFVKTMDPQQFHSRFPLAALVAALVASALFVVAAASSAQTGLLAPAIIVFLATIAASAVLVARELARARRDSFETGLRITRPFPKGNGPGRQSAFGARRGRADRSTEEEALRRTQKAEAVDRLRDGIVHDLNNRLMVISANIDAVARQIKDQPLLQRKLLSALVASDQAASLLARSTAFARQHRPHVQNVELGERIESIAALMGRSLLRDTVELRVSVEEHLWPVAVDPDDLETAIVTLSAHARDTLAQGGTIRIEASNTQVMRGTLADPLLEGDFVRLVIDSTDAGDAAGAFDDPAVNAFALDDLDMSSWEALRRGLHFLHALGGATEVRRNGNGLRISLYLKRAELPQRIRPGIAEEESTSADKIGSTIEILVVDDEVEVALAVQTMLDEFGYVTHVATDAAQALRSLHARSPELVLMDVSMPGTMNGVMLAREVRQSFAELPIVLFTGNPEVDEDQSEFPLLHKPVVSRDLHAAIQRQLRFAGETKVIPLFPRQARSAP